MSKESRKMTAQATANDSGGPTEAGAHLPKLPSYDELLLIRKGLRKRAVPSLELLPPKYACEGVGRFEKVMSEDGIALVWTIEGGDRKRVTFEDLCNNPANELDRLEFGWMIANFARLDGEKYLSQMRPVSYEDYQQDDFNRRYLEQEIHFQKLEHDWRHWAVVKPGHMKARSKPDAVGSSPS